MLMGILSKAATVAMLSFVVSSMLAMGAGLTVSQISGPLRNARLVVLALLANFVLMPLGALALAKVLWLDEPFGVGLLLLGCAAGAPFLPKLAELAKGNLAFAVGAMVLLMVVTVGYLPMVLPLLLPGVTVDPWQIACCPSSTASSNRRSNFSNRDSRAAQRRVSQESLRPRFLRSVLRRLRQQAWPMRTEPGMKSMATVRPRQSHSPRAWNRRWPIRCCRRRSSFSSCLSLICALTGTARSFLCIWRGASWRGF